MKRREFIAGLGGTAAWPVTALGQQNQRVRRVGLLMAPAKDEADYVAAFRQELQRLGWTEGRNIRFDERWGAGNQDAIRQHAVELTALGPDVILGSGTAVMTPLLQATRTVPIVFVNVADPVGAGFVHSLAKPGSNATGFMQFEYNLSAKWVELLKQIAPNVTRAAVIRDAGITAGIGQFAVIQSMAPGLGIDVSPVNVSDASEIERAIAIFAQSANGGLIVTASAWAAVHRGLIVGLASRYRLPAVYFRRNFTSIGGLVSYGIDLADQNRQAAGYTDRILKGEKPADLPVQAPTKYELVVNLKAAKAQGISLPPTLLARADEVIE